MNDLTKTRLEYLMKEVQPLKAGFDALSDHVIVTDENGLILYANKAAERETGFPVEEMIGKSPAELWGSSMPKEFYDAMWHRLKDLKMPFVGEVENRRKDGAQYWQELHVTPVLGKEGDIRFFIAIEPDITDRKKKEQFRDEFLALVGHQLNRPIAAINWTLALLAERGGLSEQERKMIEEAYQKGKGMGELVADLLALAHVGREQLKSERIDLAVEAEHIMNQIKSEHPQVSFTFERDDHAYPLETNKALALQVFINIIADVAEYAGKPGDVKITLKREGATYLFSAENKGEPIPEGDQHRIFSRFFRAANAPHIKKKGSGLGLYITKMIADNFGWDVWFKSPVKDGKGTAFFVSILPE